MRARRRGIGEVLAREVTTLTLRQLQKRFKGDGYAHATINRVVTTAYSALKFAAANGVLPSAPVPPKTLKTPKPRQGFLEQDDYLGIHAALPEWAQDPYEMFYRTGWRRSEVLWLTWDEVDLDAGVIRLDPDRDKNGETRVWPLKFFLGDLIERRLRTRVFGCPYVFHRDGGQRIGFTGWRHNLRRACVASGRKNFYTHDCRRTAVRALTRANVPRKIAMRLVGHKTEEMYDRYDIVSEGDLDDAVGLLEEYAQRQSTEATRKVVAFEKKAK